MRRHNNKLATLAAFAALFLSSFAMAQADTSTDSAINVDAQPLAAALKDFSDQTGLQLAYVATLAENKTSNGVENAKSPSDALDAILDSTGLEYRFVNDETIAIGEATEQGGDSDSKNLTLVPTLTAQNTSRTPTSMELNSRNEEGNTGIVTGKVTDARTGANLKGARVTIEETGQWVRTNDLGEFRFVRVPAGTATLTVSFLGYAGQSVSIGVREGLTTQDFGLRGGSELEEIIVYGQRSARATALNLERTAPNTTTVLSSDVLGQFNGTTVSEALRRAPGVAFVPDDSTGDGSNIIIRGIEPDLNQIELNGRRLLDGSGVGRAPDLSGLLTENIGSITINKSLLPSQDSNGVGGLVEIETRAPLDREDRFASFGLEYGQNGGDFGDELLATGTLSAVLAADDSLGASVSAAYRDREVTRLNYGIGGVAPGQYLPLDDEGQPSIRFPFAVDPTNAFPLTEGADLLYPNSVGASQGSTEDEILTLSSTLQKEFGNHTSLRFDITYIEQTRSTYSSTTRTSNGTGEGQYDLAPVAELGGELRQVLVAEDVGRSNEFLRPIFGTGIRGGVSRSAALTPDVSSENLALSLRGDSVVDTWQFTYGAGYTNTEENTGDSVFITLGDQSIGPAGFFGTNIVTRDQLTSEALNNTTSDGRLVSFFAPLASGSDDRFVLPLFNADGFAFYNSVDNLPLNRLEVMPSRASSAEAWEFEGSAKKSLGNTYIDYIQMGFDFQQTVFSADSTAADDQGLGIIDYGPASGVLLSDLGLSFTPGLLDDVGASGNFDGLSRQGAASVLNNAAALQASGLLVINEQFARDNSFSRKTTETTFAPYLQSRLTFGKLEVVGGVRLDTIEIESDYFTDLNVFDVDGPVDTAAFEEFVSDSVTQTELLPRVLANFRATERMLIRAGYFTTVSRPRLENLTQRAEIDFDLRPIGGPGSDQPELVVQQGNPDLRPSLTHNYNIDFEWYFDDVGVLKIAGFYKRIEDPVRATRERGDSSVLPQELVLPDAPFFDDLDGVFVDVVRPFNADQEDEIWGLELTAERQLTFLPGFWNGFGVYANYTYTDSESTQRIISGAVPEGFVEFSGVPFEGSPEHQGTFGFTYSKYGWDGSLLYSEQARRLTSFNRFFLHDYAESVDTLDLRVNYRAEIAGNTVNVFLTGRDLLSDEEDPFLESSIGGDRGIPEFLTGGTYFGGRAFSVGVLMSF